MNTFAAIVLFQLFCDHLSGAIDCSAIFVEKIARGVSVGLSQVEGTLFILLAGVTTGGLRCTG